MSTPPMYPVTVPMPMAPAGPGAAQVAAQATTPTPEPSTVYHLCVCLDAATMAALRRLVREEVRRVLAEEARPPRARRVKKQAEQEEPR